MNPLQLASVIQPLYQLSHALRGIEGAGCLKDNPDHFPGRVKGSHVIRNSLVFASVAFILAAMAQ